MLNKLAHNSLWHISKRTDNAKWKSWLVRAAAVIVALIISAIVSCIFKPNSFGEFIKNMFVGTLGTPTRIIKFLQGVAMLLLIALAITPAFKMKFWNIGAEGQVLMGALMSVVCIMYLGGKVHNSLLVLIMFFAAVLGGGIWGAIPALFKAKWNTNETLFTLMMNYVAMGLVSICIASWVKSGSQVLGVLEYGAFPKIGKYNYILNIIIVAVITVIMAIYLKFSKHGYEISVVGESQNTAKYIGISVPKVIIRTMIMSGALAGVAGWIFVAGTPAHTISTSTAGGLGFTAILVSWLGNFNPVSMVITSLIVQFFDIGSDFAGSQFGLGSSFSEIITGVFFFVLIACEFFVNYRIQFNTTLFKKHGKSEKTDDSTESTDKDAKNDAETCVSADEQNAEISETAQSVQNDAEEVKA